jgi:hypothetical protein
MCDIKKCPHRYRYSKDDERMNFYYDGIEEKEDLMRWWNEYGNEFMDQYPLSTSVYFTKFKNKLSKSDQ